MRASYRFKNYWTFLFSLSLSLLLQPVNTSTANRCHRNQSGRRCCCRCHWQYYISTCMYVSIRIRLYMHTTPIKIIVIIIYKYIVDWSLGMTISNIQRPYWCICVCACLFHRRQSYVCVCVSLSFFSIFPLKLWHSKQHDYLPFIVWIRIRVVECRCTIYNIHILTMQNEWWCRVRYMSFMYGIYRYKRTRQNQNVICIASRMYIWLLLYFKRASPENPLMKNRCVSEWVDVRRRWRR